MSILFNFLRKFKEKRCQDDREGRIDEEGGVWDETRRSERLEKCKGFIGEVKVVGLKILPY